MDSEARTAALTIFFTLFVVKITTLVMIFVLLPNDAVVGLFLSLNWFWFIPPVVLLAGAGMYWTRLIRMRRRRRELLRQEFTPSASPARGVRQVGFIHSPHHAEYQDQDRLN